MMRDHATAVVAGTDTVAVTAEVEVVLIVEVGAGVDRVTHPRMTQTGRKTSTLLRRRQNALHWALDSRLSELVMSPGRGWAGKESAWLLLQLVVWR